MTTVFYKKAILMCVVFGLVYFKTYPATFIVDSVVEYENALEKVTPNDSIIWEKGTYYDANLTLDADGIFFIAEEPGKTIFSGSSTLKIEGDKNTIYGFQFVGGKIVGDVLDISGNHNKIEHLNFHSYDSHYYLRVRPNCQYNVISFCNFEAKPKTQESSVVQIEATEDLPGYHLLSHCSFKNHTAPSGSGDDYGIEALRIGYSYQRTFISRTIVEYCYFEKCHGDIEIISNKACENVLRYNTFYNNERAHLTLRHGSRNMVYGNFFIKGAGIRIKEGQNNAVVNNYFDNGEHMAINVQNHHFDPVDTVKIVNNTFVSYGKLILGGAGDFPPKSVSFANNLFSKSIDSIYTDPTRTETWDNNVIQEEEIKIPNGGFLPVGLELVKNEHDFYEPIFKEDALYDYKLSKLSFLNIENLDDDYLIEYDIIKQKRNDKFANIPGCFLPKEKDSLIWYVDASNTGPAYLH